MRMTYLGDERYSTHRNVVWLYEHPTFGKIGIVNPRLEPDGDDGGIYYSPEWDKILVNGEEATPEQEEDLANDVLETLRGEDWS
jgi:hypothetical protein